MFIEINNLLFKTKYKLVIITFIQLTNVFDFTILLSVYFPIIKTVIICKTKETVITIVKLLKSFNIRKIYNGTNNLSII